MTTITLRGKEYQLEVVDTVVIPVMRLFGFRLDGTERKANSENAQEVLEQLEKPSAHQAIAYSMANTVINLDPAICAYRSESDWVMRAKIQEIADFIVAVQAALSEDATAAPSASTTTPPKAKASRRRTKKAA